MFLHSYEAPQLLAALLIAVLDVVAVITVWRSRDRSVGVKALWSLAILVLPLIGSVGYFVNQGLGYLARRLDRRA